MVQAPMPDTPDRLLWPTVTFILGAFITHVWNKFRTRTTVLRYYVFHNFFGSTVTDPKLGSVKVMYGETEVKNLYVSTVTLSNDSGRDLADLVVNVVSDPDSGIIASHGRNQGSLNDLPFTPQFAATLATADKTKDYTATLHRRDYTLPVLNRGDEILVTLLITNFKGNQPFLTVGCDKPGVKLQFAIKKEQFLGEPRDTTAVLGALIVLALLWPIIVFVPNKTVAVLGAGLLGALCLLPGVAVRKLVKVAVRLLS